MQLMSDAVAVLGSRHGLFFNPMKGVCHPLRFAPFDEMPALHIRAGMIVDGRELVFPLCPEGERFRFFDQRISPCGTRFIGVDAVSAVRASIEFVSPFRPRDAEFSTMPVIGIRLSAARLGGQFRWTAPTAKPASVQVFFEISGPGLSVTESGADAVNADFGAEAIYGGFFERKTAPRECHPQHDRIVVTKGTRSGLRFVQTIDLESKKPATLDLHWCSWNGPVLEVSGERRPFRYAKNFPSIDAVAAWARKNPTAVFDNARVVDRIVADNNCSAGTNHLLAMSLHSWLVNTWWVTRDGADVYTVWEGNCHFHSTVDVEYTQSPFYLAVWPELLRYELDFWTGFAKDGSAVLGDAGKDTRFLSHDTGAFALASGQAYHHEMPVEETTNFIILLYAYWRRTGDAAPVKAHTALVRQFLAFIHACDTTGTGVPDKGVANTVDDASPAIQFGRDQMYLAVKTLAACVAGAEILRKGKDEAGAKLCDRRAAVIRKYIARTGWKKDHFVTLLDKSGKDIVNPWSGKPLNLKEVPGWDSPHIYSENGVALCDMVGLDLGLKKDQLITDLRVATARCLREYGCVHSDFSSEALLEALPVEGLAGASLNPGWISMNMLRDIAAFYRGVDLRALADRYWDWIATSDTQDIVLHFETFGGNNLHIYPRGIAIWGYFDALAGFSVDKVAKKKVTRPRIAQIRVPILSTANWKKGTVTVVDTTDTI